jgi:hypothetical protein
MKKVKLLVWVGYFILIIVVPFIIVKIAQNEQEIKKLFFLHVIFVIPIGSAIIKWYKMKNKGFSNKEIWRSFLPFFKKNNS